MKLTRVSITCDLSSLALEDAGRLLPPTKVFRLQIHPDLLQIAKQILGDHIRNTGDNPLAPVISIEIAAFEKRNHWALWSGDECVWSPGA